MKIWEIYIYIFIYVTIILVKRPKVVGKIERNSYGKAFLFQSACFCLLLKCKYSLTT
jgi:hypothetical protein